MLLNFLQDKLPFQLDLLPKNSYLVGGSVRDALLKREKKYLDLELGRSNKKEQLLNH